MLFHLYGGEVSDDDMKSHAKEILDVADRYGIIDLKLAAEACLVETTCFTMENLMDLLLVTKIALLANPGIRVLWYLSTVLTFSVPH
jgi:hypothetical protein